MTTLNLFSDFEEALCLSLDEIWELVETDDLERVSGLQYIPNFINCLEERELLAAVDGEAWSTKWSRRTQNYGTLYESPNLADTEPTDTGLPLWSKAIAARLVERGVMTRLPNQIGVNEYLPGQGIAAHVDHFGGPVVSLSLNSGCVMDFIRLDHTDRASLWLAPRSIVVIKDQARHNWTHGIAKRQKDIVKRRTLVRQRRVSITFRGISY